MAIKGLAYTKTTWTYGERPVSSAKLNTWDERIEAALEMVFFLLSQAWGGGGGILRGAAEGDLQVSALDTPGMSVQVAPGWAFISAQPFRLADVAGTVDVPAPVSDERLDLVQARLDGWTVGIKQGPEGETPEAPMPDPDCIALAHLRLRPGMTAINDSDDGVNGYVIDQRTFL